ncbi:tether containing UBX domain for GLUT4 [Megalopta genalis]|uniref:tether containing UBX domain for GLUT4 n=1 Tax=Megalopta genalis TaxID=115081 RepID=UPI003FD5B948
MAAKSVTVLTPNNRRQNVKVTPNTTIFQILEEICKKHEYNVDDYDVKYHNRILDINTILRFSSIPNNALLEMAPRAKPRPRSTVTVCIQSENGEQIIKEFMPNITLAELLLQVYPDRELDKTALTYIHREVFGTQALKDTTLMLLGLTHGKAVLRLLYRNPEEINAPTCKNAETSDQNNKIESCMKVNKTVDSIVVKESKESKASMTRENELTSSTSASDPIDSNIDTKDEEIDTHEIHFLGERNALAFNQAMVQALSRDEFPDSFYDVTMEDAKVLLRDAKRRREELEEAPLLTNDLRESNHEKVISTKLNKYYQTIIRVQFPDQFVLQGIFQPTETVQMIYDFIKNYLDDPTSDFTIFTAPPKHILDPSKRLIDEYLVPSAIVYYSGSSHLNADIKEKIVDPKEIEIQVAKFRKSMLNPKNEAVRKDITSTNTNSKSNRTANTTMSVSDDKIKASKLFNSLLKK